VQRKGLSLKALSAATIFIALSFAAARQALAFDQSTSAKAATAAAEAWLQLVDDGKYNASWLEASTYFRNAVTKLEWKRQVSIWRTALGSVVSRKFRTAQYLTTLPGAPDGDYVLIQYDTTFTHKKSAVETITPMLDADGKWRVSEYSIK